MSDLEILDPRVDAAFESLTRDLAHAPAPGAAAAWIAGIERATGGPVGVLASNAGGVNVLRYGMARDLIVGLEAVLPDGALWNGFSGLRKDNRGYDLKQLFIGAEGTLGIITAASLRMAPVPAGGATAMLAVPGPAEALALLALAQGRFAGCVTAFELISGVGLDFLAETLPAIRQPLPGAPWSVLLELSLPEGLAPDAALTGLLEQAMEAGLVTDGALAQSGAQAAEFWSLREHLPEANRLEARAALAEALDVLDGGAK